jgi:hypothetical protein
MTSDAPRLLATHLCEDALASLSERLVLYGLFQDRYSDAWPAVVPHMVVANTWLREEGPSKEVLTERVVILTPDRGGPVAEAASAFQFDGPLRTNVSRFVNVVLPRPGVYRVQVWLGREQMADYPLIAVDTSVNTSKETDA